MVNARAMPLTSSSRSGSSSGSMVSRRDGVISSGAAVVDRSHSLPRFSPGGCRHEPPAATVLVIFADHAACPWLRPLRRGFRHCFVVMRAGSVWLACEPLKDRIELDALAVPDDFDLAAFYSQQGHQVLLGERLPARPRRHFALAPMTCVTVVKRLLGIDAGYGLLGSCTRTCPARRAGSEPCQGRFKRGTRQLARGSPRLTEKSSRYIVLDLITEPFPAARHVPRCSSPYRLRRIVHG